MKSASRLVGTLATVGLVCGTTAIVSGQGSGGGIGGGSPACQYSLHEEPNETFNEECTRFYSCCSNFYGVNHGPGGGGTHQSLGQPQTVPCSGTIYTAAYIDGVCTNTGAYVGDCYCDVQVYPDAVLCP